MRGQIKKLNERREETESAEILHLGRYEEMPNSFLKQRQLIEHQGYRISGFYEEVYLVLEHIKPNPRNYETLLRYEVTNRQASEKNTTS